MIISFKISMFIWECKMTLINRYMKIAIHRRMIKYADQK